MSEMEQGWSDRARYDLETARVMLASGRYLYVVFCCQQAVEKALKAVIVRKTGALPPRVHNLLRLAEAAGAQPDQEQNRFLGELSAYYIRLTIFSLVTPKRSKSRIRRSRENWQKMS